MKEKVLITGIAGFIGFHLASKLSKLNYNIVGIDIINDYYDVNLKYSRLNELGFDKDEIIYSKKIQSSKFENIQFVKLDLIDEEEINFLFQQEKFDYVINLAAQAGVRHSIKHPRVYLTSNVMGFMNILEASHINHVKHLIYASSSSVYGGNKKAPFSVEDRVDTPVSMYAVSKKTNELMAHSISSMYALPTTGLRFFTVYGPWGRPDMAYFSFVKKILHGESIDVYNNGDMERDFTYIDDIVEGITRLIHKIPEGTGGPMVEDAPYKLYNIGNNKPVKLMDFIHEIETNLGKKAEINFKPMQMGDVLKTNADLDSLIKAIDYRPKTTINEGIKKFVDWYKQYYS